MKQSEGLLAQFAVKLKISIVILFPKSSLSQLLNFEITFYLQCFVRIQKSSPSALVWLVVWSPLLRRIDLLNGGNMRSACELTCELCSRTVSGACGRDDVERHTQFH